jgi:hypothetical protein
VHEIKHDGYRLIVRRTSDRVRLYTRGGFNWADRYPRIVEALRSLRVRSIVIDGHGSTFTIRLPRIVDAPKEAVPANPTMSRHPDADGNIALLCRTSQNYVISK